jgi:hypothetical protein
VVAAGIKKLEPLAPDACRSDPSAPCYYLHLKRRALNGDRDKLSARELAFVGVGIGATAAPISDSTQREARAARHEPRDRAKG